MYNSSKIPGMPVPVTAGRTFHVPGVSCDSRGPCLVSSLQKHAAVATPVLPKILPRSPSSNFVRNLSAEEDAYAYGVAQDICARIVSQRPPRVETVESISAVSSSDTNDDDISSIFSFTITVQTVQPNDSDVGERRCLKIESVTSSLERYVKKALERGQNGGASRA